MGVCTFWDDLLSLSILSSLQKGCCVLTIHHPSNKKTRQGLQLSVRTHCTLYKDKNKDKYKYKYKYKKIAAC